MKKSCTFHPAKTVAFVFLGAILLLLPWNSHAAVTNIFADFNTSEGTFNQTPTFSGSTVGILASSTADRVTTGGPLEGVGYERLVLSTNGAASVRVRFLSGTGTPANNVAFSTTTAGTDGWIGYYLRTTNAGWTAQIWIEGAENNGGIPKDVIADGQWHLYEWNLDDESGGPDGWGSVAGIVAGDADVQEGSYTIDSVLFRNIAIESDVHVIDMDFVARNGASSVADLLVQQDPCVNVPGVTLTGPVATNSTEITVTGVSGTATAITVYQNTGPGSSMVQIGSKTSGITAGDNAVSVSALVKDAKVVATQTLSGQESCVPSADTGLTVGGGANPSIRVVATVRENTDLTGPVGAAGSGSIVSFLGASSLLPGGAPEQGIVLQPGSNWQTISFTNTIDPLYTWAGTDTTPGTWDGPFGALDGFGIACEGDSGPLEIYLDDLANGTHGIIQDWESDLVGTAAVGFSRPSVSGSTSGNILPTPNESVVSNDTAYSGSNSCRVRFQFSGNSNAKWLRLVTSGATPVANPQLDVNEPISIKVLLLPPGAPFPPSPMPPPLSITIVGGQPVISWTGSYPLQSSTNVTGTYVDVGVTTGPYTVTSSEAALFYRLRGN